MFQWLSNVQLRNGADGLQNGMRLAQVEAIRRNSTVTLVLTNDAAPTTSSTAASTGRNWVLKDSGGLLIQAQGSQSTYVQTPTPSSFGGTIVFNSLGGNNLASNTLLLTFTHSPAKSGDHPMAVLVTKGGRVRMCDPARTTGAGDPEACE